jgi:uncharacterized protein (TIGR03437 family)
MRILRSFLGVTLFSALVCAQNTPVNVSLSTQGFGYGCCGSESGGTTGSLAPFPGQFNISFGVLGPQMNLTMYFTGNNSSGVGDVLQFFDPAASVGAGVIGGTARLVFGTGSFNGATGTLQYAYTCVVVTPGVSCVDKDGAPLQDPENIALNGSGVIYVPAPALGLIPPGSTEPPPPPPGSTLGSYHTGTNTGIVNGIYQTVTGGTGQIHRLDAISTNASSSLTITPPWQPVPMTYTASATCPGLPQCWLSIPTATGMIPAFTKTPIRVTLDPPVSAAGVFPGNVALTLTPAGSAAVTQTLPLNAIVTSPGPYLALSQTGLQFQAATGANGGASQNVSVFNQGTGSMPFTTAVSTTSGGNWLSVTGSGTVPAAGSSILTLTANPTGLNTGVYYGRVDVLAPSAVAAPQSIIVALNVQAPSGSLPPVIAPAGLVYVASGEANLTSQTIQVTNPSSAPMTVTVSTPPATFYTPQPPQATIGAGQSATFTVSVSRSGLTAGVYQGPLTIQPGEGTGYSIPVEMVVQPAGACTPTQLVPVLTSPINGFKTAAGLPVAVQAMVVDDCGTPLTNGSVIASFTGDSAISLVASSNGVWSGTWTPGMVTGGMPDVTLSAVSFASGVNGVAGLSGTVVANSSAPVISTGGAVSAASLGANVPLAPGSFLSIFGTNLADTSQPPSSLPLPTTLGNTQVLLAGMPLPLNFAGPKQINAIVPYGAPVENLAQLVVIHAGAYSAPQTLAVADTQPAMFTQDQSGSGPGVVVVVKPDGTQFVNTATAPASAGDSLVLYCAGLGAVSPPVADGAAAPSLPLSHATEIVSVTIGGQNAAVAFSGLAPGFAGLYQVNVTVPPGISAGTSVPLVVTAGALSSLPVTIAIQ